MSGADSTPAVATRRRGLAPPSGSPSGAGRPGAAAEASGPSRPRRWIPGAVGGAVGGTADSGSASVLVLAAAGVLLAVGVAALVLGSAAVAGQRARLAADLAAIAAATQQRAADGKACATAAAVARANGAGLDGCSLQGADVTVGVSVDVPMWPEPARARSRAGPARPG